MSKIDRSMSIVPESVQNPIRRNSPLKSRAQIPDGSLRRFFVVRKRIAPLDQRVTVAQNDGVGIVDGSMHAEEPLGGSG
jgi:hypothetical protein